MNNSIIPTETITLPSDEIQRLFTKVNGPRDYYVNPNSIDLIFKIIELWFEEQGYDFWNNPYPEVLSTSFNKDEGLTFTYTKEQ